VAQVAMRRDFPYLSVDAYLVIRGGNTGHVAKRNFLVARDAFADLMLEVRSLSWNDGAIDLDIQRVRSSTRRLAFTTTDSETSIRSPVVTSNQIRSAWMVGQ
jgi:hypothetical protein